MRLVDGGIRAYDLGSTTDAAAQHTVRHKVEQLREAHQAGCLDSAWDPIDILAFVSHVVMALAGQLDLLKAAAGQARDPSLAARCAAVVAVQRLFPASGEGSAP
ncbi:hypothetical protein ACWCQK_36880 [Streptomyces sp. NPDC002306]